MRDTRRSFVMTVITVLGSSTALVTGLAGQRPSHIPSKSSESHAKDDDTSIQPAAVKTLLESSEKDMKKNVEKLYQLATELREEVQKTDSVQVLSLPLLRKAEEIEKLAKAIRTRAKG